MRTDWNPALYRRFEDQRTRPAQDLLARVPLMSAMHVIDLGCGPGNSTELLTNRFPSATVSGIDTSEAMLASARERLPHCFFLHSDVSAWQPEHPPDLLFANAVLQWVPDHEVLLSRLFGCLAPSGVLAVQMPDNLDEPTHRSMREVATHKRWAAEVGDAAAVRAPILSAIDYYDSLAPHAARVEIWRTTYHHPMDSAAAIVDWLQSTGLRPFLEPLSEAQRSAFLFEYEARIAQAYPTRRDGKLLLAFPRLFIVAQRNA